MIPKHFTRLNVLYGLIHLNFFSQFTTFVFSLQNLAAKMNVVTNSPCWRVKFVVADIYLAI